MHRITSTNGIELSDDEYEYEHLFALIYKGTHSVRVITRPCNFVPVLPAFRVTDVPDVGSGRHALILFLGRLAVAMTAAVYCMLISWWP
jgi:hypothetical protein